MNNKEINDLLIIRFLNGNATEKEAQELIEWLNADHKNRILYFHIKRIWQEDAVKETDETILDMNWERLKLRIDKTVKEKTPSRQATKILWNLKRIAVAASVVLLAGTTIFLGMQNYSNIRYRNKLNQITVPLGSRSNIMLPDGSNVWLNAGSKLTYSADFGGKERTVSLEGEGFFDITHRNNSPFFVNAGEIKIKVLGTKFNVKSYPEENTIETTLVNGIVEVKPVTEDAKSKCVILEPNQKLTYARKERNMKITAIEQEKDIPVITPSTKEEAAFRITANINPEVYTSWKDGKLIFEGESLAELAPKLERFYNVKIGFQDEKMKEYKFTGTLQEVTIEEVLRAIERTSPISFEINKNKVILKKSKFM